MDPHSNLMSFGATLFCVFLLNFIFVTITCATSSKIRELKNLNKKTTFISLCKKYNKYYTCNSKKSLDKLDLYELLLHYISTNEYLTREQIEYALYNGIKWEKYIIIKFRIKPYWKR